MLFKNKTIDFSLVVILFLSLFTRFFNLNWSQGFAFHPDENNMISSVVQMNPQNLNPHFFAYGQFPLYLAYFTTPKHDFQTIALTLRFWSAVFSCLSLLLFYFIGKEIFSSKKLAKIFLLLLIFTPALIQSSHFGTTESILIFVFAANIFLSFKIYDSSKIKYFFLAAIVSGIGLASKISSLVLITPILISALLLLTKKQSFVSVFFKTFFFFVVTLTIGIALSPYSLINSSDFISSMKYEFSVANGSLPVFYTRQFISTIPYFFQIQKVFPYTNGIFVLFFSLIGSLFLVLDTKYLIPNTKNKLLLITIPSIIYFLYQGQIFVKWTRFMAPIFFLPPLLSIFVYQRIKNNFLKISFICLCLSSGIFFMKTYFSPDVRIVATNWINQNISPNSTVLSESGNVVSFPLYDSTLKVNDFDFYNLDYSVTSLAQLDYYLHHSDYIFVPSRRVFKNQSNSLFPDSQKYYQDLFSGNLSFSLVKQFNQSNSLFLNSENAEETWSVFDNPKIRIFKKNNP